MWGLYTLNSINGVMKTSTGVREHKKGMECFALFWCCLHGGRGSQ